MWLWRGIGGGGGEGMGWCFYCKFVEGGNRFGWCGVVWYVVLIFFVWSKVFKGLDYYDLFNLLFVVVVYFFSWSIGWDWKDIWIGLWV